MELHLIKSRNGLNLKPFTSLVLSVHDYFNFRSLVVKKRINYKTVKKNRFGSPPLFPSVCTISCPTVKLAELSTQSAGVAYVVV